MTGLHKYFFLSLFLLPLAACDGYEPQLTNTIFPYGNERTAGSGVVYVRALMLPEKELKVEPVVQHPPLPVGPPEPKPAPIQPPVEEAVKDMQPIFHDKMLK